MLSFLRSISCVGGSGGRRRGNFLHSGLYESRCKSCMQMKRYIAHQLLDLVLRWIFCSELRAHDIVRLIWLENASGMLCGCQQQLLSFCLIFDSTCCSDALDGRQELGERIGSDILFLLLRRR